MVSNPLVSIVMPSYRNADFVEDAIESVLIQSGIRLELIVQDGASNDGTVDILRQLAAGDRRIDWRSEHDTGPAQAINRALARSRGTIIGWLNSDDLYAADAVRRAVEALSSPSILMVYGHGELIDEYGQNASPYLTLKPEAGLQAFHGGCYICQPTVFFKRTMYRILGPLDETQKASFDFEYWLRAFSRFPERIDFVDAIQARSRLHGRCITNRQRRTIAREGISLTAKFLGHAKPHWAGTYLGEIARSVKSGQSTESAIREMDVFLDDVSDAYAVQDLSQMRTQMLWYLDHPTN